MHRRGRTTAEGPADRTGVVDVVVGDAESMAGWAAACSITRVQSAGVMVPVPPAGPELL
ncbi:hypothetical protein [Actinomadura xylanilytica]|uniref:hypothetical protein n=1 Tax=Actinomadura xylanilytica TaxID=887459 RepID=UPI00255AD5D8|nr:hypothetical protein [Actinomadura xylanilytica]MDL4773619.1 hypothetical protein [Actinomadura xylanilytica]